MLINSGVFVKGERWRQRDEMMCAILYAIVVETGDRLIDNAWTQREPLGAIHGRWVHLLLLK